MKLQILVNHYNEDITIVKRFLESLAMQKNVEFEVLILSDGGKIKLTQEDLVGYPFMLKYAYASHSGVCHTRNILLDQSNAEYIIFCDIDDVFSKYNGLELLLTTIEQQNADIVGSVFDCEHKIDKDNIIYTRPIKKDTLHVHGKIFRRQYLIDNNLRFPDEMEFSGDMMFLWLAFSLTNKIVWLEDNFYIWKWNDNSITRGMTCFHVQAYGQTLRCYHLLAQDIKKRNRPDLYKNLITTLIAMVYLDSTHILWNSPKLKQYSQQADKYVDKILAEYFDYYKTIDEAYRKDVYFLMLEFLQYQNLAGPFENIIQWGEERLHSGNVLIIGYGIVGHNLEKELKSLKPDIYDKYQNIRAKKHNKYSMAFICVPTPYTETSYCDITEVKNAIAENNADIYVIKSTVLPGTIDQLCQETGKNIIFSPEYYGETQHCNNYNFDFTILGGNKNSCIKVQQLLQKIYDGRHKFYLTDAKTAELAKYMENSYLATKVSFCQQFFNLAEQIGVNYEDVRELFILDPRVNPSHTYVYREQPYWDSKCLNKDVPAIANTYSASFLQDVIKFNEEQKKREAT